MIEYNDKFITADVEAPDEVKDVCERCGKEITYDKDDGYWDSFVGEAEDADGRMVKHYTPSCDDNYDFYHEPVNFKRGDRGIYFYKNGK